MAKVYGIDLGTTYSCVSCIDAYGQPEVLPNDLGKRTTPSVVYLSPDGKSCCVGEIAKNGQVVDYEQTVSFIKREMGKEYKKPTKFPNGLTPTEISARILRKLIEDANNATDGAPCYDVVITCPAYFGTAAREQTKQAGEIAGLNVLRIVNEPTAAAVAYGAGLNNSREKMILVYDLGGGTFDLSLIKAQNKKIEVLVTGGDAQLGGYDWDRVLANHLLKKFNEACRTSFDFKNNADLFNHFMLIAENAKITLSSKDNCKVNVAWEGKSTRFDVSRSDFNSMTEHLLQKTISFTKDLLLNAKIEKGIELDSNTEVLLVGGSSRMSQITEGLKKFFAPYGCTVRLRDPDECVAKGAALVAQSELSEINIIPDPPMGVVLHDVTSKSYGLGCSDRYTAEDIIQNIIFKNAKLPISKTETFETRFDGQQVVNLPVFETDTEVETIPRAQGIPLDSDHGLEGLPPGLPQGTQILVNFSINKEGILTVTGSYADVQIEFPVKIKGIMQAKDIRRAKEDLSKTKFDS